MQEFICTTQYPLSIERSGGWEEGKDHPSRAPMSTISQETQPGATMETAAVTCACHSRLQRKILRIYLRTNKIMMVLFTLTDPLAQASALLLSTRLSLLPQTCFLPPPLPFLCIPTSNSLSLPFSRSVSYFLP